MACVLCSGSGLTEVSSVDCKTSEPLRVCFCDSCGLVQQDPIPTEDELRNYYSHNYRIDYKQVYSPKPKHVLRAGRNALNQLDFLKQAGIDKGSLLDVGAGGGEFVYMASRAGFDAQGVEPNIGYSEFAQSEYDRQIQTGHLDDIEGRYDLITMFHVLEHMPSPVATFEKLFAHCSDGGSVLIEVPWIETTGASPHNIYFKAHLLYFGVATLTASASPYFEVTRTLTDVNLRMLFRRRPEPVPLELPDPAAVEQIRQRLQQKGWSEYLLRGGGAIKPISRLVSTARELSVSNRPARQILDSLRG